MSRVIYFSYMYRALDKFIFKRVLYLSIFKKKKCKEKFLWVLKTYTKKDKVIISIEPGLTACFPRLFINKKVNSMVFNFSLA